MPVHEPPSVSALIKVKPWLHLSYKLIGSALSPAFVLFNVSLCFSFNGFVEESCRIFTLLP